MRRLDLSDVGVIVSIKVDSRDRLANLDRLASYYAHVGDGAEILAVEQGANRQIASDTARGLDAVFIEDPGCHWKTRNMNLGARLSTRPVLLMSDCDTVPHPEALAEGLNRVAGGADVVTLYNGVSVNVSQQLAGSLASWDAFFERVRSVAPADVDPDLGQGDEDQAPLYGNARYRAVGGCFLADRRSFLMAGGWNENFVSYGFEDMEFDRRIRTLGLTVGHTGRHSLFHFAHRRFRDSRYSTFHHLNEQEYERVAAMAADDLRRYVGQGFRAMSFDHDHDYARESDASREIWRKTRPDRVDLSEVVIVVIADARQVGYEQSCLGPLADYLDAHFWNFDLRLCELAGTHYKHIRTKKNLDYRTWRDGYRDDLFDDVLAEAGRAYVYRLRLGTDAEAQYARATSVFERLRGGVPADALFEQRPARRA